MAANSTWNASAGRPGQGLAGRRNLGRRRAETAVARRFIDGGEAPGTPARSAWSLRLHHLAGRRPLALPDPGFATIPITATITCVVFDADIRRRCGDRSGARLPTSLASCLSRRVRHERVVWRSTCAELRSCGCTLCSRPARADHTLCRSAVASKLRTSAPRSPDRGMDPGTEEPSGAMFDLLMARERRRLSSIGCSRTAMLLTCGALVIETVIATPGLALRTVTYKIGDALCSPATRCSCYDYRRRPVRLPRGSWERLYNSTSTWLLTRSRTRPACSRARLPAGAGLRSAA